VQVLLHPQQTTVGIDHLGFGFFLELFALFVFGQLASETGWAPCWPVLSAESMRRAASFDMIEF